MPVFNVTLQLEYNAEHAISNEGIVDLGDRSGIVLKYPQETPKVRGFQIIGPRAQIRYTFPTVRAGEKIVVSDAMKFCSKDYPVKKVEPAMIHPLRSKLRKHVDKLYDICLIDTFIYSDNCAPLSSRVKLLWFKADSFNSLTDVMMPAVEIFWGGQIVEPGVYFSFPWRKLFSDEYAEMIIPNLASVKTSENKTIYLENPIESERALCLLRMPPWNYYQHQSGSMTTADLVRESGFVKLPKNFSTRFLIWLKSKRKFELTKD
jgi:hypothetical protein